MIPETGASFPMSDAPTGLRAIAGVLDGGMSKDGTSLDLKDKGHAAGFRDSLLRWADTLAADPPDGLVAAPARLRQLSWLFGQLDEKGTFSMPSSLGKETEIQDDLRFWAVLIETLPEEASHASA